MAVDDSTAEGGWPPPGLENALRVEQRGAMFFVVNDKGEKVFYAVTRHAAEEARAYLWTCMAAGVQPQWLRPRRAIDPATGKPLPTIDEKLAALKERVEKPAAALGRMEKKPPHEAAGAPHQPAPEADSKLVADLMTAITREFPGGDPLGGRHKMHTRLAKSKSVKELGIGVFSVESMDKARRKLGRTRRRG